MRLKNAGIDPRTIRTGKWYQESTREDDEPHSPSLTREWDIFSGAGWASYQVREPSGNDEDRLAMKSGDMPPPLPQRVKKNPRTREDQVCRLCSNSWFCVPYLPKITEPVQERGAAMTIPNG